VIQRTAQLEARSATGAVWFDARGLQEGFKEHAGRGIGTYVAALAAALDEQADCRRLRMLVEGGVELTHPVSLSRILALPRRLGRSARLATQLHQHVQLAAWLSLQRPAAVHFPAQTDAPALVAVPTVLTVHDLVLHRHGAWYAGAPGDAFAARLRRARFRTMRLLERRAVAHAARVIVPSRVTAEELAGTLGVPRARIAVIPEAAARHFSPRPAPADATIRERLGLPERYLLHAGGADARKRVPELIRVFDALARDDATLALVLVGPVASGRAYPEVRRALGAARARDRIVLPGVVPEAHLPAVYRGAAVVVLATRHEGFGLPVVEAFASGVPVVATAADAVREVAGDAALLVPVAEVGELADAVRRVLHDPELARELRARGLARAAQHTWTLAAAETLVVYEEVAGFRVRSG